VQVPRQFDVMAGNPAERYPVLVDFDDVAQLVFATVMVDGDMTGK
jgi:hypothetical protein